ncbi:sugar ABC transporter permease [Candidatus Epulonipiscium fishelsonii]|uniref:Sugar ABC transporter permease n=1 Tax=Candidatus Epulonipiscium fishelsonii TaxID=77094 RepID=A0ACC8XFI8_9FIRM|nr:sugar ABC transporter permease [Epulopiscium sp. SCG-B05WGA-EpuloA1]ONI41898.1 sugar ABC transporter permease [Epulopiscium sp. SCG-B11WGA-EpuloA1]
MNIKKMTKSVEFWVFIIITLLSVLIHLKSGLFFTNNNIVDIMRSMIVPSIYALCAFLAFISTGPDVSFPLVGALSSYLAIIITNLLGGNLPWIVIYIIAIAFGCLMGFLNGYIIVKFKFSSLIVTLGTTSMFSGILLGAFEAERMDLPTNLHAFGTQVLLSVQNKETGLGATLPMAFLIMVVLYIIVYFVLNYTIVGRGIYAIGGDEISAERAGFDVSKIRIGIFVFNGALAAIGGMTYAVLSLRYLPTEYAGAEMVVIAAVILGGTRIMGGIGTLKGCILGTLLLNMVTNSLILVGISVYWQKVFIGAIIIIGTAIPALQVFMKSRKSSEVA